MKAEDVAAWLERSTADYDGRMEAAIRALIAERDALREALASLLRHPGIADMAPEDKDPEDHALERAARAALERKE